MCRLTTLASRTPPPPSSSKKSDDGNVNQATNDDNGGGGGGGVDKYKHEIEFGLLTLSILYGFIVWLNPSEILASSKHCDDAEPSSCQRPDLLAYKITSGLSMTIMGIMGIRNWHFNPRIKQLSSKSSKSKSSPTAEERLFGSLKEADYTNILILCYQVWDFFVSLTIPEHRQDYIFLIHHVLAGLTAYFSLEYSLVGYYSIYFGGCSEFSSIFLIFTDIDEMFVIPSNSKYSKNLDIFILLCKGCFVITFFCYRVYGWIQQSLPLWDDVMTVVMSSSSGGTSTTTTSSSSSITPKQYHRPAGTCSSSNNTSSSSTNFFLYCFLFLDFVLGLLQLYWFGIIVKTIIDMVIS